MREESILASGVGTDRVDHPRMCGKNLRQFRLYVVVQGSPPHVREESDTEVVKLAEERITPACAGRIRRRSICVLERRDHPRMCGKNRFRTGDVTDVWGSPPHVREEFKNVSTGQFEYGITPAHAGRIFVPDFPAKDTRDHPRACGKNRVIPSSVKLHSGSPPRMREECSACVTSHRASRITPAHAGRMARSVSCRIFIWDHPRACGKNRLSTLSEGTRSGSPPRMREEFLVIRTYPQDGRITPAHAGRIRPHSW